MTQDFSGQNLQGRSFRGQDLTGADFSNADIRSADFSKANLRGAQFVSAKAGLQRRWAIGLVMVSWLLSVVSGFFSAIDGSLVALIFNTKNLENVFAGAISLTLLLVFFTIATRKGLVAGFGAVAGALAVAVTVALASAVAGAVAVALTSTVTRAVALALTSALAGALAVAGAGALALALALALAVTRALALALAVAGAVALALAVAGAGVGVGAVAVAKAVAVVVAVTVTLLSAYIGWRALAGDKQHAWIRGVAVAFAAIGGTSFRAADLTDADFTRATPKSTDFRGAILTRTCWYSTKKLDRVRPGTTYLKDAQVRKLLITGQGQDKNFDRQDLRGVNFQSANLQDASFIGADLSYANLQDADLSRAKLVQTQLDKTDLTGATLTGAYIKDWGITGETKLNGVRCEYVFMRLPTKEDPDPCRKPDNKKEVFEDGDFADFIQPIVRTLDLYHNQGVDPRAIAISFKQLAENHPEADLRIVGMEVRGEDKFLLRAETVATADKSELSQEYFDTYNQLKALPEREIKLLIAEKDSRIHSLETMVETALKRPSFYAQTYNNRGDTMSDKSSDIKFGNVGGDVSGLAGGDIKGVAGKDITGAAGSDISGTVTTTIGQLQSSDAPEAPKLADLLKQLQTAIESDVNLSEDDKAEALEQVKALAEAGQSPQEGPTQKVAKTAMKILKGTVVGLPTAATLYEACNKLLPAIAQVFGL